MTAATRQRTAATTCGSLRIHAARASSAPTYTAQAAPARATIEVGTRSAWCAANWKSSVRYTASTAAHASEFVRDEPRAPRLGAAHVAGHGGRAGHRQGQDGQGGGARVVEHLAIRVALGSAGEHQKKDGGGPAQRRSRCGGRCCRSTRPGPAARGETTAVAPPHRASSVAAGTWSPRAAWRSFHRETSTRYRPRLTATARSS